MMKNLFLPKLQSSFLTFILSSSIMYSHSELAWWGRIGVWDDGQVVYGVCAWYVHVCMMVVMLVVLCDVAWVGGWGNEQTMHQRHAPPMHGPACPLSHKPILPHQANKEQFRGYG